MDSDPTCSPRRPRSIMEGTSDERSDIPLRPHGFHRRLVSAVPYVIIFIAAAFFYRIAHQMEFDRVPGRIGPDIWPKLILVLTMIACVWGASRALLFSPMSFHDEATLHVVHPSADDAVNVDEREVYPLRVWATLAGTVAYIWMMQIIGFFLSSILFLAFVLYNGGYRRLFRVAVLAIAGSVLFMALFVRVVYVSLPLGEEPFTKVSLTILSLLNF